MAEESHQFEIRCGWEGLGDGDGILSLEGTNVAYGRPSAMGGAPGRTNPEELLLASVSSCYAITLGVLCERRRLPLVHVDVPAGGVIVRQPGGTLKFTSIELRPVVRLKGADEAQLRAAEEMAHKAETYCPISGALRGNVEVTVKPEIVNE